MFQKMYFAGSSLIKKQLVKKKTVGGNEEEKDNRQLKELHYRKQSKIFWKDNKSASVFWICYKIVFVC